jgi:predicted ATP-grasp superfamily ATP-dependent carboligase
MRIALVGASVRSAAQSALRAGYQPVGADLFADSDLEGKNRLVRITDYPAGLASWLAQTPCAGWIYTGGLENYPNQVAAMAAERPLLGCGDNVLQAVRSPQRLAASLEGAGLRFPKTVVFADALSSKANPGSLQMASGRWLQKTYRGSGGSGVSSLALAGVQLEADGPMENSYVQQYIEGRSCSALFLACADRSELLGITGQLVGELWTGAAPYQYCGSIGPWSCLPAGVNEEVERIGAVLVKAFGLVGLFGVDLIIAGSQVWTLEVNPRYTASVEILERASGLLAMGQHVRACQQQRDQQVEVSRSASSFQSASTSPYHGKVILFAQQDVAIQQEFTQWALGSKSQEGFSPLADIPRPGTAIRERQPVLTLFAAGESIDEVEGGLRQRVARVEQKLYG